MKCSSVVPKGVGSDRVGSGRSCSELSHSASFSLSLSYNGQGGEDREGNLIQKSESRGKEKVG